MKELLLKEVYAHPLINPAELQRIMDAHYKVSFKKGANFLKKGEISNGYLLLENGIMRSFAYDYNENDITTDFFSKHEIVIEVLSLFQRVPSQETIQALTDCEGWMIDFDVFQELYHSIGGFSEWGRLWMTNRLFHFKLRSVEMVTIAAKDRYLQLIKDKPEIVLQSPLKHIASYLGITDSSFSRIRKEII